MSVAVEASRSTSDNGEGDFLLESIRDLDAEYKAGDIDEADYWSLRESYVKRAAILLKAGDAKQTTTSAAKTSRPKVAKGLAVAAVVAVVAIGLGFTVAKSAGQRMPTENITGSVNRSSANKLADARSLESEGKYVDALNTYREVLASDPTNSEALTYQSWLLYQLSTSMSGDDANVLRQSALTGLRDVNTKDPTFLDARAFRGVVELRVADDPVAAGIALRTFLASRPTNDQGIPVELVESALQEAIDLATSRGLTIPATAG